MPLSRICVTLKITQRETRPILRGFSQVEELFSFALLPGAVSHLMVTIHRARLKRWSWDSIDLSFPLGLWAEERKGSHILCMDTSPYAKWCQFLFECTDPVKAWESGGLKKSPQDVYIRISGTCRYVTFHDRRGFADGIKLWLLRWREYLGLSSPMESQSSF